MIAIKSDDDMVERLVTLAKLHRAGDLSLDEFASAKAKVLHPDEQNQPTPSPALHRAGPGFCVRDFGAKGDGRTDDTAAFSSAFAAAILTYEEMPCGKGCGRTVADVFVPSGPEK